MAASSGRLAPVVTIAKLLGVLAVTAVLAAGLVLPYVGGLGYVASSQSAKFLDSTCNLTETPPPQKTTIYASDRKTRIATLFTQNRTPVKLSQVPPFLVDALIATEDRRFYSHHGVDMRSLIRSALNTTGGDTQGGSTLTMQYVKQVRYYQAVSDEDRQKAIDQNIDRKIEDARCALEIEKHKKKNDILLAYLNIAFFGENAYGIGTAAKTFFAKDVSQLTLPEAALLVGAVKAPTQYDPFINPEAAKARRDEVIQNMVDVGKLSQARATRYEASPVRLATKSPPSVKQGCINNDSPVPNVGFFCDYVVRWLKSTGGLDDKMLNDGGLSIVTTLSPSLQSTLQGSLFGAIPAGSPSTAIMPVIDPKTGNVLAMATSKKYGIPSSAKDVSHSTVAMFTDAATSTASTMKYFSLLAALTTGVPDGFTLGSRREVTIGQKLQLFDSRTSYYSGCPGNFVYPNADPRQFATNESLASAIAKSSNTYFGQLVEQLFGCNLTPIVQWAQKLGLSHLNDIVNNSTKRTRAQEIVDDNQYSFVIGSGFPASPLEMAGAYAASANDGVFCPPAPVLSITGPNGKTMPVHRGACQQLIQPQVARRAVALLTGDTHNNGTTSAQFRSYYDHGGSPVAGKTGTNNASSGNSALDTNASLWFVGLTPSYAATTAVMNLKDTSAPLSGLPGFPSDQAAAHNATGSYAGQIWVNAMAPVLLGTGGWSWPGPNELPGGVDVPNITNLDPADAKTQLAARGLKLVELDAADALQCGAPAGIGYGKIAWYSPTLAAPGSTVTYCASNGGGQAFAYVPPPKPTPSLTPGTTATPTGPPGRRTRPPRSHGPGN